MKKRKTPYTEGLPKKKTNFDASIVSESDNERQGDFWRSSSAALHLNHLIERQELEDCLNLLESRGFSGDLAVFVLGCLQMSGGVV